MMIASHLTFLEVPVRFLIRLENFDFFFCERICKNLSLVDYTDDCAGQTSLRLGPDPREST